MENFLLYPIYLLNHLFITLRTPGYIYFILKFIMQYYFILWLKISGFNYLELFWLASLSL